MKIFKKFLAALIAVVMALGVFAFAACKNDGKGNGDGDGPNGGTTLTTAQFLNALKAQQVKQLQIVAGSSTKMNNNGTVIEVEKSGYDAKYNLTDKSGDIEAYYAEFDGTKLVYDYDYTFIRDGYGFNSISTYNEARDKVEPENYSDLQLSYGSVSSVMGGLDMFDLFPVALPNVNYVLAKFADAAGALTIENGVATLDYNKAVYNIVQDIKEVVDGLTETTTVGDILANENIEKYLTVFTELIPAQLVSTGLEYLPELLDMLNSIDLTDEEVAEQFGDMAPYIMMAQMLLDGISFDDLAALAPETGSTTYDYIVKILDSDALKDIVNTVLANFANMGGGAEQAALTAAEGEEAEQGLPNLTNISVGLILGMVNAGKEDSEKLTLEGIKTAFGEMAKTVTEEGFYFTMPALGEIGGEDNGTDTQEDEASAPAPAPMYISNVKVEYTLVGGTALAEQGFSANVTVDADGAEVVTEYTASITYSAVKYQLADISNNVVNYDAEVYNSGTTISYSSNEVALHTFEGEEDNVQEVIYGGNFYSITVDLVNGEIKEGGVKVYDKDKNVVAPEADGSYKFEVYRRLETTDDEGRPQYDYTDKKTTTITLTVTGGIITQEFIDEREDYNKDYYTEHLGYSYYEVAEGDNEYKDFHMVYYMTGKVGDLLTHLKAQASQPNA